MVYRFLIALIWLLVLAAPARPQTQDPAHFRAGTYEDRLTVDEALGADRARQFAGAFGEDHFIAFSLFVPETYDPSRPSGLLVYISPSRSGAIPNSWKKVIADRNLIWISVDESGNRSEARQRIAETLAATAYVAARYPTDANRVYVAGFSGGGRMASMMSYYFPAIYRGAIYICGANGFPENDPATIDSMKQDRFVFLTGTKDFNQKDTETVFADYKQAGIPGIELMVVRNLAHELPGRKDFARAMDWLDRRNPGGPD